MRATTRLRELLSSPDTAFLMEAHDGLSARIVEEAGFAGIWASGLTISASFGLRDNNELSWSQMVDHLSFMVDASELPVLADGDTGFGNFNNVRRLLRKLEQAGAAGVVIEDKVFPKSNSFVRPEHALADTVEFSGRIRAAKDTQTDPDFVVVARTEALTTGRGLTEALDRAAAYRDAGADGIFVASRQETAVEIFAFTDAWRRALPVVIVPTKYWKTPTAEFRSHGIGLVIWANHLLRSAIAAMSATARRIKEDESLVNVEPHVATLDDLFRLQRDAELQEAERRYLP
jgi:phosphoenolpyruvate phosphomutase